MIKYILKNYYKYVIAISALSIIWALSSLLLPDVLADIISIGIENNNISFIYANGIKLVVISLVILVASILSSFFSNKLGAKIGYNLRSKLYEKALNLDEANINKFGVSSIIVRNTNDINQIQTMVSIFFKTITFTIILCIGGIIKAIIRAKQIPILSLIVILSILVVAIVLFCIFITVIPKYNILQEKLDKINKRTQEILQGILVIKAFNQQNFEYKKTAKLNTSYTELEYYLNKIMCLLSPFVTLMISICTIAIIFIIFKNAHSLSELANMLAFSEYATQIINAFLSLAICFVLLPKAFVSYNRITEIINSYNLIYDNPNAKDITNVNSLELKNVSFSYPNSQTILSNINVEIKKGERVAIIGPTGSGKSTLVNLLNRFYDVDDGSISINNVDIRSIKIESLNKKIATVFQNDFLMRSTIKESLFEKHNEKINDAFKIVCLPELINDFKKEISYDGTNLSGGQKQRFLIARALLKNPDVLILDDALSAVDYQTEKKILNNIKKEYPNLIQIIISSRIVSIKNVDKIIVINNGQIIACGNHNELLKNCPTYNNIIKNTLKEDSNE